MKYRTAFPDYDPASMPAIPACWQDDSFKNDACPFFLASPSIGVFVDYASADERETGSDTRFCVVHMETGAESPQHSSLAPLLDSNDWPEVLAFIARRTKLAAAYVALVGYDPFTDDPSISVGEVESALAELTALHAGVVTP